MNVLVTGAGGLIGRALAARLAGRGDRVVWMFRDRPQGMSLTPQGLPSVDGIMAFGDVADRDFIYRLLVDYEIESVFHLAAQASVRMCHENPEGAVRSNIVGTWAVLDSVRERLLKKPGSVTNVCIASTDKVYGNGPVPYREDQPLQGVEVYSSTKVAADLLAQTYHWDYGVPVKILRSPNVYGPGDMDFTRLIPRSVLNLLQGRPAILYSGAADMVREFVYVDDEVDAYLALAERGEPGEAYNAYGSGPVRVGGMMEWMSSMFDGGRVEIQERPFREIPVQYMDGTKIRTRLGWEPKIINVRDGLPATIEFYRQYLRGRGIAC